MHTIINLWKFRLNWSSKLQENNGEKTKQNKITPSLHRIVCFQMPVKGFLREAFLRFKCFCLKLPLSLELRQMCRFLQGFIIPTALSALYQVSFYGH